MTNNQNAILSVILTGATGMVGEGVLHECLQHPSVEKVLVLTRKPCGINHPKLKEIIHANFFDIQPLEEQLTGYNSCFFCLGVSSVGMDEEKYFQATYILTTHFAQTLAALNPGMTFCYVSGAGTDSTEKGKRMWARIKGKTENALVKLPFKKVYNFRPGIIEPTKGLKNTLSFYKYLGWLLPVIRLLLPRYISSLKQLGMAMINASSHGYEKNILEIPDIIKLAKS
ncbi:MAG: epimerase [Bacteroidetes bacterium]|nr:epimerase [Bacteroidota bacterium]